MGTSMLIARQLHATPSKTGTYYYQAQPVCDWADESWSAAFNADVKPVLARAGFSHLGGIITAARQSYRGFRPVLPSSGPVGPVRPVLFLMTPRVCGVVRFNITIYCKFYFITL